MSNPKMKIPKIPGEARTFTFTLTLPGLISVAGIAVLALTGFFIIGILIGRGYQPEQDVPELAKIMPTPQEEVAKATEPETEVLKPEELQFTEELTRSAEEVNATVEEEAQAEAVEQAQESEAGKVEVPEKAARVEKPEPESPAKSLSEAAKDRKPGEQIFDYVYQVASFKEGAMADAFAAKLEKAGFKTGKESVQAGNGTWHRVLVLFQGTPDETDILKAGLKEFKIKKPLMRSKKPI